MTVIEALMLLAMAGVVTKSMFLSFRAQRPADYSGTGPAFSLKQHLSGRIRSEGVIYGPTGRMANSFVAEMHGEWEGDKGSLAEHFIYSNGSEQHRKWHLTLGRDNTFTATADDIVGVATGIVSGATVRLKYRIVLPPQAGGYRLAVTDWMYLTRDGAIMNKSEMRMFGFKVAELNATMRTCPAADENRHLP